MQRSIESMEKKPHWTQYQLMQCSCVVQANSNEQ